MLKNPEYLRALEEKNNPWAIYWLASRYYHGTDVPQDLEKALEYYRRAHDLILESGDDRYACYLPGLKYAIGICLCDRLGDKVYEPSPQASDAVKWLQDAYAMNSKENPMGIHYLASCYYHGGGVPKDIRKAHEYYRQAYELALESDDVSFKKYIPALKYAIGSCFYERFDDETREPSQDIIEGMKWVREAAAMGNEDALRYIRAHESFFSPGKILQRLLFVKSRYKFGSPLGRLKANIRVYRDIQAHREKGVPQAIG